jgi:hypothetical protein
MQRSKIASLATGLAFAVALVAMPAQAQMPVSLNIGGGMTLPSGELAEGLDNGYHAMAGVRAGLPALPVHLRVDGMYNRLPISFGAGHVSTIGAIAALGYDVVPVGPARLYALGGGGYYWSKADVPDAERVGDFGWNAGAGLRMNLLAAKFFVEARYHSISTEGGDMTNTPITLGLSF